ncbi:MULTISPECIES: inositol monophosphatase family protein [unclassified Micromonospora]|uniref:inositol monophosphatase family protein n=1 Tax=unclassified Micromonospora TaxID=2617518 RepID=UPI0009D57F52|nr:MULTISPECIES: inositol monophosphatase family protein [unclassified Micromonospora]MDI5936654.1 inositol monophosphatase family protein [Micromonospora sp. DH15]OON32467.1 hypothetical protein BSA16_05485 [Micromonospora sp. Rc5]
MTGASALDVPAVDLLDVALRAAYVGAAEVIGRIGRVSGLTTKSSPTDPVTDADRGSDEAIRAMLAVRRPDDGVLSEEGPDVASRTGLRWVVDPLDGTVNYLYGIANYAVSVACERFDGQRWEAVVGVVHDVGREETFTAVREAGSRLGGRGIAVTARVELSSALVATGFSYRSRSRSRQAAVLSRLLPRVRDIRTSGSHALDLCWTAAGRYDGCFEDEVGRWDWAAGALIVREAGGVVSPLRHGVVASGPGVHEALYASVEET